VSAVSGAITMFLVSTVEDTVGEAAGFAIIQFSNSSVRKARPADALDFGKGLIGRVQRQAGHKAAAGEGAGPPPCPNSTGLA
jgi:hypothetical protein